MAILRNFLFLVTVTIADGRWDCLTIVLKENHPRALLAKFGQNWYIGLREDVHSRYFNFKDVEIKYFYF